MSELEKWSDVAEEWAQLINFLEWLGDKGVAFCEHESNYMKDHAWHWILLPESKLRDLFCESYDIDQVQLEKERRALLEEAREANK